MTVDIYKATNSINDKAYIGLTSRGMLTRREEHIHDAELGCEYHFHRAIRKHGIDVFKWEIIAQCKTREDANNTESCLIAEHKTFISGYNSTTGGDFGFTMSKETKNKISKTMKHKLNKLSTEEKRQRMLNSCCSPSSYTKERGQNISKATKGKTRSAEARKNLSIAARKRDHSNLIRQGNLKRGSKWYNNGFEEKMLHEMPTGWIQGRICKTLGRPKVKEKNIDT